MATFETKIVHSTKEIRRIMLDPRILALIDYGDIDEEQKKAWRPGINEVYIGGYIDGVLAGLLKIREFTNICLEAHIQILPEYWKTGISDFLIQDSINTIEKNQDYHKVMTTVPSSCVAVTKSLERNKFRKTAELKEAIVYRGDMGDILFYEYTFKR